MSYTFSPITYQYNPDAYYTGYGRAGANFRAPSPFFTPRAGDPVTLSSGWSDSQRGGPTQFPTPEQPNVMASLAPMGVGAVGSYAGSLAGDAAAASRVPQNVPFTSAGGQSVYYNPEYTHPFSIQPGGVEATFDPRAGTFSGGGTQVPWIYDATDQYGNLNAEIGPILSGNHADPSLGSVNSVLSDTVGDIKSRVMKLQAPNRGVGPAAKMARPVPQAKDFNPSVESLTQEAPMWSPSEGLSSAQQFGHNLYPAAYQGALSGLGAFGGSLIGDIIQGNKLDLKRAGTKFADVGIASALGRAVTGSGLWGGVAGTVAGMFRVICTELNSQGLLTDDELRAEQWYTLKKIHPLVIRGYHVWAVPYVRLMQKSSRFSAFTNWWAGARAKEILYKCGKRDKSHFGGKIARLVVEPFCFVIGCVAWAFDIPELEWRNGLT